MIKHLLYAEMALPSDWQGMIGRVVPILKATEPPQSDWSNSCKGPEAADTLHPWAAEHGAWRLF